MRASFTDRFFHTFFLGLPWWFFLAIVSVVSQSADPLIALGWIPWLFWIGDTVIDNFHTGGDVRRLTSRDDVVLATRAEYVGGHPELPHGRFALVTIEGSRENPMLCVLFPSGQDEYDTFEIPILDLGKTKPQTEKEQSFTGTILATLSERPGRFLSGERVTLNVEYQGPGGRKHNVELTSFFHGNDEIRNWRNYLVCAQAEADTGVTPYGPWKSLKPAEKPTPEEGPEHERAGDGSKLQPSRRAFERR